MTRQVTRGAAMRAVILVFIGATGVQLSAAIALGMFDSLGVLSTSSLRLLIAAVALLLIFRPRLRGRSGREWAAIVLYGFAMASMNIFLYLAIDRIPLGIATTIDFLGPCLVALLASRRLGEVLLALVAFGGVALIAGLGGPIDGLGLVFAGCAAVCMGLYTLLAARVGQSSGGLPSVALSVAVAAIITLPLSAPTIPQVTGPQWGMLLLSALLGTALAFTVDTMAGRWTSARVIGVLFAFDPLVGTLVGALLLGQVLTAPALLGIALVIVAGAGIVWMAGGAGRVADPMVKLTMERTPPRKLLRVTEHERGAAERRAAIESLEIERKYEVVVGAPLPAAEGFAAAGFDASEPVLLHLSAVYFDTPDRALGAIGVAVRRRTGGKDAGWHLKERRPEGSKELLWDESDGMPEELVAEIARRIGSAELVPLAALETERTVVVLRDASGAEVVEIADDTVRATDHARGIRRAWREWEAEVLPDGDPAVLDAVEGVLRAAGAAPSPSIAKVARATGSLIDAAIARGADAQQLAVLGILDVADRLGATVAFEGGPVDGADPEPARRIAELHGLARATGLGLTP